jgi:hypothetical protein
VVDGEVGGELAVDAGGVGQLQEAVAGGDEGGREEREQAGRHH